MIHFVIISFVTVFQYALFRSSKHHPSGNDEEVFMEPLPHDRIQKYILFSKDLLTNCSNNLFIGIADGGNHFLEDGIKEGATLVFDREKSQQSGLLSCYMDSNHNLHLLKYNRDGYVHLGRLVGILNTV